MKYYLNTSLNIVTDSNGTIIAKVDTEKLLKLDPANIAECLEKCTFHYSFETLCKVYEAGYLKGESNNAKLTDKELFNKYRPTFTIYKI